MLTVFVPAHVNRDSIITCFVDDGSTFIDVETEQQAIEQQGDAEKPFIVFETDYFTVYNVPEGPVKCDYISRNYISMLVFYDQTDQYRWRSLSERNGLKLSPEPPIIYFVHESCIGDIHGNATEENTIVQYYKKSDLKQFAEIAKTLEGCCNHCFITYENGSYQCVSTSNTDNSYTYSSCLKWLVVSQARKDTAAIERFKEQDRLFNERQPPKRLPNGEFKLKDENGDEVLDGEQFTFIIPRDDEEDYDDEDEDEDDDDDDDYEPEQDGINVFDGSLMANPGHGDIFSCETIDGIVYLTHNDKYLCCPDDGMNSISVSPELPEPSERLQINYDGSDITLTRWGDSVFASCDWVKASVGCIGFNDDEYSLRYRKPMRLRLSKHRMPVD
ncbi:hypothetical protein FBU59_001886 [Linderina macrospora]|uniref:Uncharacterized protein n=1 Tax=Linderina macrospora TaxID=4868 RepID=A0ACC1JD19_9FUNG|nr:hypothetical protein FBU59_001886 [Linderina macrospora]